MKGSSVREKHLIPLTIDSFEKAERFHFSTAHAIERYLTGVVPPEAQRGNRVCSLRLKLNERLGRKRLNLCGLRIIRETDLQLDDDFILRFLEYAPVYGYGMIEIPVRKLYILLDDQVIPLDQCAPYLYLKGETAQYSEYCQKYRKTDYMELSQDEFEKEITKSGAKRFQLLADQLERDGYDEKKPIVICHDGQILDGQHRACWYMYHYGEESLIRALYLQMDPPETKKKSHSPEKS